MNFVIDRFETSAQLFPEKSAIICENGQTISFGDLNRQADAVAKQLVGLLGLDSTKTFESTPMVGLLMERHIGIVCMMLAIHKAGCAYVPVDPAFPPDRQSYILDHSRCNVLIVDEECYAHAMSTKMVIPAQHVLVSSTSGNIIRRFADGQETKKEALTVSSDSMQRVRRVNKNKEALAYVLYTSGSTGKPKGVAVKQIGVDNIIHYFAEELSVNERSRVMGLTTFCFDISVLETFVPLTRGAAIVLATSATRKDPFAILDLVKLHGVNVFQATPTTYEMLLATGWEGDQHINFLVGGEAFRPTILPLAQKCASLLNVYGPTETTIWSTAYRIEPGFADYASNMGISGVPIGKAISQTSLYLVGEAQPWKEVGPGEEGELFIGGIGVAAGYLHAPDLTADRFIANPFGEGMVYRTGDVIKQLPDGNYIFVRRLDDQVKVDGFRIELEEIEKVFMQHSAVEQAVALVRGNKLVIYIKPAAGIAVATEGNELSIDKGLLKEVHASAATQLTYYMMPKHTVIVKEFIKTPNGKLDKKALPDPKELQQAVVVAAVASQSIAPHARAVTTDPNQPRPVSVIICDAVEKLRGNRPHPGSSLGAFGLDSLGSVMLMRQLTTALKGEVAFRMQDLFTPGATVRSLGQLLYSKASDDARSKLHLIPESDRDDIEAADCDDRFEKPDHYGASLLANKRLFEGLRGIFTFMVLWNHWYDTSTALSPSFNVDTTLFFLISGFTTASQLRVIPDITKVSDGKVDQMVLAPKTSFPLSRFWLVRAVGLYPILWFALVINAPIWWAQDKHKFTDHEPGLPQSSGAATCTFLYVIGMNIWDETCTNSGPDVRYSSSLLVIMFFYGLYRFIWTGALRRMTSWTSASSWCQSTAGLVELLPLAGQQNWSEYLGKFSIYLSYNIYHPEVFWKYTAFVVVVGLLMLWEITLLLPKIVSNVEFFMIAAWTMAISEMWCGYRIATRPATEELIKDFSTPTDDANRLCTWLMDKSGISALTERAQRFQRIFPVSENATNDGESSKIVANDIPSEHSQPMGYLHKAAGLLWRFAPDLLAVSVGIMLSCIGDLCRHRTKLLADYIEFMLIPFVLLVFVVISVHQRGSDRYNLSRLFLESDLMNFLGYCSYPVYLFQNVFLQYYFTFVFEAQGYSYHPLFPDRKYFRPIPLGYRFAAVIMTILFSWIVQKFFQDYLITNLFSKWLARQTA